MKDGDCYVKLEVGGLGETFLDLGTVPCTVEEEGR